MTYSFKEGSSEELNKFSFNSPKGHIFQTTYWGSFKKEWTSKSIIGLDNKNNIVLSCIMLIRKLPILNKNIAYIPRGFICDYTNFSILDEFTSYLNSYAKKNKIAFITIDPDIHIKENTNEVTKNADIILNLKKLGYIENSSKNFENIQPNFVFRLNLDTNSENKTNEEIKLNILNKFSSKARYNIKLGIERGLSVESYTFDTLKENKLEIFQELMDITGKRDNFIVRKKDYFFNMLKTLNPYCKLYLVKYSYEADKKNIYKKLNECKLNLNNSHSKLYNLQESLKCENDEKKIIKLKSKIESKTKEIKNNELQLTSLENKLNTISIYKNKEIYLSGAIYLTWGNKAWYLYGASHNILRDTMPNFLMQYEMIKDSIDNNCSIYDFRGVSGDLNEDNPLYGLYRFKKMFNGDFVEFIGEYTLILDKYIYTFFKKIFPKFKDVRNFIFQNKKK
ncbi:lipid II:glycine glycyltransferase FemX [Candidatus Arthromitus sp. SFB-rat-Yit]|uniref:lipid II:glycine glycyltransferase FemX n=1 Tax=Candidatus Arthromitus sp. SFB-rat-Yit TaxID=1041504 RepID=UPI000227A63C|nr:peptidoglycan bridge formation glycyltransferase FemA/FemB family protein [Candidatus Arthromitus sp. SFB-rat-Yit]BAK80602.1 FemAB family protein [Candidatus Arthromitus sp. SFB-rat-Yit]